MLNRIEHLGIAIKSLETSDHLFAKLLGKTPYKQEAVEREGVKKEGKTFKLFPFFSCV